MKAKVIREPYPLANVKVGEIIEIIPGMETDAEGLWNVPAGKLVLCKKEDGTFTYASPLDMEIVKDVQSDNWDAFRREAAKDILAGISTNIQIYLNEKDKCKAAAHDAIALADELVRQLKDGK